MKCLDKIVIMEDQEKNEAVICRIKHLAKRIDLYLKVSTDVCSSHEDGRLPILDLKTWIGVDKKGDVRGLFTQDIKDVSSRVIMHMNSSHSEKMKFNVSVNEDLRILRNCSPHTA